MKGGLSDDGSVTDLPWASVFDPTANARALSAIQAEGFRAASQLVDRLVRIVDDSRNGSTNGSTNGAGTDASMMMSRDGDRTSDLERLATAWWGMFGQLMLRPLPGMGGEQGSAALDLHAPDADGRVTLEATKPGVAETEVWLHNNAFDDMGVLHLRCSDLLSHDGFVISSAQTRFDPEFVTMPGRCSRGSRLRVTVTDDDHSGVYRGTLLVNGHPDLWLPVVLRVRATVS